MIPSWNVHTTDGQLKRNCVSKQLFRELPCCKITMGMCNTDPSKHGKAAGGKFGQTGTVSGATATVDSAK